MEDLENFKESLKEIGVSIPDKELDSFINTLGDLGNATSSNSQSEQREGIKNLTEMIDKINSGEHDRIFSEDEYKILEKYLPKEELNNFVKNLDGTYSYIGSSMSALAIALQDNTKALLNGVVKTAKAGIKAIGSLESGIDTSHLSG